MGIGQSDGRSRRLSLLGATIVGVLLVQSINYCVMFFCCVFCLHWKWGECQSKVCIWRYYWGRITTYPPNSIWSIILSWRTTLNLLVSPSCPHQIGIMWYVELDLGKSGLRVPILNCTIYFMPLGWIIMEEEEVGKKSNTLGEWPPKFSNMYVCLWSHCVSSPLSDSVRILSHIIVSKLYQEGWNLKEEQIIICFPSHLSILFFFMTKKNSFS